MLKSIVKYILKGKRSRWYRAENTRKLVVMGNGPSLRSNLDNDMPLLQATDTMAVNFAAKTDEFFEVKPRWYVLADPHFFLKTDDVNVAELYRRFAMIDWRMTIFVPFGVKVPEILGKSQYISVERFNFLAMEGPKWFRHFAFEHRWGMPRPRNVLIPAIMIGIWLGYKEIYVVGADHTWLKTLSVDDDNHVVSIQPHFYTENHGEEQRIRKDYLTIPLHSVLQSQYIAFHSYHTINQFARARGVEVYNATPGSMIDAFQRRPLPNGTN